MAKIAEDENLRIDRLILGPYETNCYILTNKKTNDSLVVDAPADASSIIDTLRGTNPRYILLTHDHYDHTGTLVSLRTRLKVPLAASKADSASLKTPPEIILKDGDLLNLGDQQITTLHTPGHTPGSFCYRAGKYLFGGDTLFPGGPGHTESPEAFKKILVSITEKIYTLADDTIVYPGHGNPITVKESTNEYAVFMSRKHPPALSGDVLWQG